MLTFLSFILHVLLLHKDLQRRGVITEVSLEVEPFEGNLQGEWGGGREGLQVSVSDIWNNLPWPEMEAGLMEQEAFGDCDQARGTGTEASGRMMVVEGRVSQTAVRTGGAHLL